MTPKLVAAGASFTGTTLLGLVVGIWLSGRTGQELWVLGGLFGGILLGGYAAFRLLLAELR